MEYGQLWLLALAADGPLFCFKNQESSRIENGDSRQRVGKRWWVLEARAPSRSWALLRAEFTCVLWVCYPWDHNYSWIGLRCHSRDGAIVVAARDATIVDHWGGMRRSNGDKRQKVGKEQGRVGIPWRSGILSASAPAQGPGGTQGSSLKPTTSSLSALSPSVYFLELGKDCSSCLFRDPVPSLCPLPPHLSSG